MILRITILLIFFAVLVSFLFGRRCFLGVKSWKRSNKVDRETLDLMRSGRDHEAFIERIPKIAERHRRQMKTSFGESLSFQKADLARIDSLIDKAWGDELPSNTDVLVLTFGAYFGETIRRLRGAVGSRSRARLLSTRRGWGGHGVPRSRRSPSVSKTARNTLWRCFTEPW